MIVIKKALNIPSLSCLKIINIIKNHGATARLIGGFVRDSLLGIKTKDIDIATDLLPHEVSDLLTLHNIKTIPTGIEFGTITAIIGNDKLEITTLRKDISCNGRHAKVEYCKDFAIDAQRRDFTINALSYCPIKHEIYDYFTGLEDLKHKVVRFIGNPEERITEDALRILRFFRFSSKYAKTLEQESLNACIKHKNKLSILSRERINQELDSIVIINNSNILDILSSCGILQILHPKATYPSTLLQSLRIIASKFNALIGKNLIYAILFHQNNISLGYLIENKFSKKDAKETIDLIKFASTIKKSDLDIAIEALKFVWLEKKNFADYFLLAGIFIAELDKLQQLYFVCKNMQTPVFPITGEDLMKLGLTGPDVGKTISALRHKWVLNNFKMTKQELIQQVKNAI